MTNRTFLAIITEVAIIWFMIGSFLFLTKPVMEIESPSQIVGSR